MKSRTQSRCTWRHLFHQHHQLSKNFDKYLVMGLSIEPYYMNQQPTYHGCRMSYKPKKIISLISKLVWLKTWHHSAWGYCRKAWVNFVTEWVPCRILWQIHNQHPYPSLDFELKFKYHWKKKWKNNVLHSKVRRF